MRVARAFRAPLVVLHVFDAPTYAGAEAVIVHPRGEPTETLADYLKNTAQDQLFKLLSSFRDRGVDVQGTIAAGEPYQVILEQSSSYDMIVMGTHGRSGIRHVLLGSVAERVIRKAKCPVLTIPESMCV
ncbi:MAG: universal stress protein [Polyangiales bacterium]